MSKAEEYRKQGRAARSKAAEARYKARTSKDPAERRKASAEYSVENEKAQSAFRQARREEGERL